MKASFNSLMHLLHNFFRAPPHLLRSLASVYCNTYTFGRLITILLWIIWLLKNNVQNESNENNIQKSTKWMSWKEIREDIWKVWKSKRHGLILLENKERILFPKAQKNVISRASVVKKGNNSDIQMLATENQLMKSRFFNHWLFNASFPVKDACTTFASRDFSWFLRISRSWAFWKEVLNL